MVNSPQISAASQSRQFRQIFVLYRVDLAFKPELKRKASVVVAGLFRQTAVLGFEKKVSQRIKF